ncbi:MAG: hypothetical protein MK100_05745 [Phycisphaerales bacterium]|nr:hypothetical protein [Phycisphaerales bacterium]
MSRVGLISIMVLGGVLLLASRDAHATDVAQFKQIGAPPEDVERGWLSPPQTDQFGAIGRCRQIAIEGTGSPVEVTVSVPGSERLAVLPVGEGSEKWAVTLMGPDGSDRTASARTTLGSLHPFGAGDAVRFDISDPDPGSWTLRVTGLESGEEALVMVRDEFPVAMRSIRSSWQTIEGEPFTLTARFESTDGTKRHIDVVSATARTLNGELLTVARSNDHVVVPLTLPRGDHFIWIDAIGVDVDTGDRLERSVLHHLHIEDDPIDVETIAIVTPIDQERVSLVVPCEHAGTRDAVLGGAEVWTVGQNAECLAWIGGLIPLNGDGAHLTLDTRWLLGQSNDLIDIELRNVRFADRNSCVLLGERSVVRVGPVLVSRSQLDDSARREMRMGRGDRGGSRFVTHPRATPGGHNLMLVHGYCYSGDPDNAWTAPQFSGDVSVYQNLDQNFSHDEFALDILSFGSQFKSYGIAGHSQGGTAGLHLYTFYWSGLDWATPAPQDGGRLLQALGTPFEGTALAGNIAALGEIFGIQCGANYDMTYDGAAYWLSFVPGWSRAETWSWTTTFTDNWWSWDYCHFAADLVLSDPEDGVVEAFSGELPGTNFMGLKEGWCHIGGMVDPAQIFDTIRNDEINAEAAR